MTIKGARLPPFNLAKALQMNFSLLRHHLTA
jgi:hypothetical protein